MKTNKQSVYKKSSCIFYKFETYIGKYFHMINNLLIEVYTFTRCMLTLLSVDEMLLLRYMNLLELSAEIVPNVCARFGEANHWTTSSFLCDGVSHDLSKNAIYIWHPICIHPFYQLIKLVYTCAYCSLPQILIYPYCILTLWVILQCKL